MRTRVVNKSTSFSNRFFAPQLLWVFFQFAIKDPIKLFFDYPNASSILLLEKFRSNFRLILTFVWFLFLLFFYVWIVWLEMFSILKPNVLQKPKTNCFWKSEIRLHQNRSILRNSETLQREINPKKHFQQRQLRSSINGQSAKNCLYACHSFVCSFSFPLLNL